MARRMDRHDGRRGAAAVWVLPPLLAVAIAARAWSDEAAFETDLASGAIPPHVRYVMYDPEGWAPTPRGERRHPITAMRAFARAAREAGYGVIITPHPNLVDVRHAECARGTNENT